MDAPEWTDASLLPHRFEEQVEQWGTWARRAWEPGTLLRLRELIEASKWVRAQVVGDSAVQWLRSSLRAVSGQDRGLARGAVRQQLQGILKDPIKDGTQRLRRLEALIEYIQNGYLERWKQAITDGEFDLEQASRLISAHAIDEGLHPEYLRQRVRGVIDNGGDGIDLIEDLVSELKTPPKVVVAFVHLKNVPHPQLMQQHRDWLNAKETNAILIQHGHRPTRSQSGSLRFEMTVRDRYSAASQIYERMEQLTSRTRLLRKPGPLTYERKLFFDDGTTINLSPRPPQVSATSLERTGILYTASLDGGNRQAIDDSLLLASDLLHASPGVSVGSAWAAIESLLGARDEGDKDRGKVVAADRAASIIAASWPRAELTSLSHRLVRDKSCPKRVHGLLEAAGADNAKRAEIVWSAINSESLRELTLPREQAALLRLQSLESTPTIELKRVQGYLTSSLRRLYRQRNLVLHGGLMQPVALRSTLRTAGPLVAAVLDRISYCWERNGWDPLETVVRAETALSCAGLDDDWPVFDLMPDRPSSI